MKEMRVNAPESARPRSMDDLLRYFNPLLLTVICILGLILGISGLYLSATRLWYAYGSSGWQKTSGQVSRSEMGNCTSKGSCQIFVEYQYTVRDREYKSDNIRARTHDSFYQPEAESKLQQYKVGAAVDVYYDPDDPTTSCLEPGIVPRAAYPTLGVGAFLMLTSALILLRLRQL